MSDVLVQLGEKGAAAVLNITKESLEKAIAKSGGDTAVTFPETNYYFPLINALLNIEVKNLAGLSLALKEIEN
jgi:hypothetical protein